MEKVLVLLIVAAAVYLFVTEILRADLVELMLLSVLVLMGLVERGSPNPWCLVSADC